MSNVAWFLIGCACGFAATIIYASIEAKRIERILNEGTRSEKDSGKL